MDEGFATGFLAGQDSGGGSGGSFMNGDGFWGIILLALLFGWGGNRGGFGGGGGSACATQADLAAGFNNSTVLSSLDDIKLGQANAINYNNQGFAGLNTAVLQGFHGVDNAICTLGYQNQQGFSNLGAQLASCCCDIERGQDRIANQITSCCCDIEKMNMQNRFDAQAYNNNTLIAIDKLGDRIIDHLNCEKTQALRDENQALRLAASQANQNQYLINQLRPAPVPAFSVPAPYCFSYGGFNNGCGCGCG